MLICSITTRIWGEKWTQMWGEGGPIVGVKHQLFSEEKTTRSLSKRPAESVRAGGGGGQLIPQEGS